MTPASTDPKRSRYARCIRALSRALTNRRRLHDLFTNCAVYSRMRHSPFSLQTVSLSDAMHSVIRDHAATLTAVQAEVTLTSSFGNARADPDVLEVLLSHLLVNALTFTAPIAPPRILIWSHTDNRRTRLHIRDAGIGIECDDLDRVFDAFGQSSRTTHHSGSGLGLAIVRKGAERMGGTAGVVSDFGNGSCFWIELPRSTSD